MRLVRQALGALLLGLVACPGNPSSSKLEAAEAGSRSVGARPIPALRRNLQGTGDDSCWFGAERDANFLIRSVNLQQSSLRTTADFEEIARIARTEFQSVGLWLTQETVPGAIRWCQRSDVDPTNPVNCLEQRINGVYGITDAQSYKYDHGDYDNAVFGHRNSFNDPTYLEDSRVLTFGMWDSNTGYYIRVYNIHGYHRCSEDHARHRRKEIEAVIAHLKQFPSPILPAVFTGDFNVNFKIGDWCRVNDVPQEGPGRIDDDTIRLLQRHFRLVTAPSWTTEKAEHCVTDAPRMTVAANSIDQLWVARKDVFPTRGDLTPRYLKYTNLRVPGTEYCKERTKDCTPQNSPSVPCHHCLSDHHMLTMAFKATCAPEACPTDGCGKTDGCGTACPCDQHQQCLERCERKLRSCVSRCDGPRRETCEETCFAAYQSCVDNC
jgi:hypothetical protein